MEHRPRPESQPTPPLPLLARPLTPMHPANCLLTFEGDLVKENVNVTFKQYHSILDIIASGIPMDYDTLGQSYSFESAGMFILQERNIYSNKSNSIALVDVKEKLPKIEIDFLELMLHRPGLVDLKIVDMSIFSDSTVRTVLTELRDASEKGIRMTAASLSDHLDDEVARSLVIELSSSQLEEEKECWF